MTFVDNSILSRSPPDPLPPSLSHSLSVSECVSPSNRFVFVVDRLIARVTSSPQSLNPSDNCSVSAVGVTFKFNSKFLLLNALISDTFRDILLTKIERQETHQWMRWANITGEFQLPLKPCHDCETSLPLTLTLSLSQKHSVVKFSGKAMCLTIMPKTRSSAVAEAVRRSVSLKIC